MFLLILSVIGQAVGQVPQTHGRVWPKARYEEQGSEAFSINLEYFQFKPPKDACKMVQKAINRCKRDIQVLTDIARKNRSPKEEFVNQYAQNNLKELQIHLKNPCTDDMFPQYLMDESYNLTVAAKSVLNSSTIWGLIRGMETFSQLFFLTKTYKIVLIKATTIEDSPHYLHRGLMLDTSRHYISVENIFKLLDAMAMNKMNVFHWHITDDESFPYVSERFPELSEKGAYFRSLTYNRTQVEMIRDHARDHGIRVIAEFDMPGHCESFKHGHPEIIVNCNKSYGPMNPIKNETYDLIRDLLKEVQDLFLDNFYHIGGDEVPRSCWSADKDINQFMKDHNMDTNQLFAYFFNKVIPLLKNGTVPMVWEDVFNQEVPLTPETIVEVWLNSGSKMAEVLLSGNLGVLANGFYLDYLDTDFQAMYQNEPRLGVKEFLNNDTILQNLIGGEACMWGEMIDGSNMLSRVWPRASAVAEVLWSETEGTVPELVMYRIEEHTCRMVRRGIPAEPASGAGYCVT